jgi:hypothetical protein
VKLLLILAAALTATVGTSSLYDNGYPPQRYQHDGSAAATLFTNQTNVDNLCGKAPKGKITVACVDQDDRTLVLPNPCGAGWAGDAYAKTACHELGHLNGWPADHPRP